MSTELIAKPLAWSDKIRILMREFAKREQPECPLVHRFAPGVYLREIFMPAGAIIIGKRHKTEHFNVILKGSCTLFEEGRTAEIKAPMTFISGAGVQKVLLIHEDMIWQTVHVTDNRDMESLEAELIESEDYPLFDRTEERAAIEAAQRLLR